VSHTPQTPLRIYRSSGDAKRPPKVRMSADEDSRDSEADPQRHAQGAIHSPHIQKRRHIASNVQRWVSATPAPVSLVPVRKLLSQNAIVKFGIPANCTMADYLKRGYLEKPVARQSRTIAVSGTRSPYRTRGRRKGGIIFVYWIVSSSPKVLRFFPITRTSFPRRPAYLIAMPRSTYSSSW
jgi:hypothetical protein